MIYGSLYAGEGAAISPMVKATGDTVLIFPFWGPSNAEYGSMRSKGIGKLLTSIDLICSLGFNKGLHVAIE